MGLCKLLNINLKNNLFDYIKSGSAISILIANVLQVTILFLYILKTKVYVDTWPGITKFIF